MNIDWRKISISEQASIKDALETLDKGALRIVLVVDSNDVLKGVVTDGDVRRALLKGEDLSQPVYKAMMKTPKTVNSKDSITHIKVLMEKLDLLAMPVVDENYRVIDLHLLKDSYKFPEVYDNPVFIMAGGFGTRLRPLTDNCPKPMLKVGDKPMLETLLLQFKKNGFHKFYFSTHYLPEVIIEHFGDGSKFGVSIEYIHEELPLGTGGALGLLPDTVPQLPLIMINGDVLTRVDFSKLLNFHNTHSGLATMAVREYEFQVPFGVVGGGGETVTKMVEKPIQQFYINAGIYVIDPDVRAAVNKNEKIDMPTLLERYMGDGNISKVYKYPIHEYWMDIGRIGDFEKAQMDIKAFG